MRIGQNIGGQNIGTKNVFSSNIYNMLNAVLHISKQGFFFFKGKIVKLWVTLSVCLDVD